MLFDCLTFRGNFYGKIQQIINVPINSNIEARF